MMVAGSIILVQQSSAQLISSYTKDATLKRPIALEEMILQRKTLGEVPALSQLPFVLCGLSVSALAAILSL